MKEYINKSAKLSRVIDNSHRVSQKKNAMQKMAWVISRDINLGMFGSSNSDSSSSRAKAHEVERGSSHGSSDSSRGASSLGISLSPTALPIIGSNSSTVSSAASDSSNHSSPSSAGSSTHGSKGSTSDKELGSEDVKKISQEEIRAFNETFADSSNLLNLEMTKDKSMFKKIGNLKFHHRHILFDHEYPLPLTKGDAQTNNIGYGGTLYSEDTLDGYERNNPISERDEDDQLLIEAMNEKEIKDYGPYNLFTNNCQHWVNDVKAKFDVKKREQSRELQQSNP